MDRARARPVSLTIRSPLRLALAVCAGFLLAAATEDLRESSLRSLRWTDPAAWLEATTRQPLECLAQPSANREHAAIEVGRAAFRTPLLLGGLAARTGLSCESCHSNGRRNPAFRFEGLSGAPGTADVTSSMMSSHRGNAVFDPKPIPDLAAPGKVSRSPASPALRSFLHGLITEEFDGREPPAAVLDGLSAYVRAIDAANCAANEHQPITAARWIDDANRAMAAASERWQAHDPAASVIMLGAARHALGRLDERYRGLPHDHAALARADSEIARIRKNVEAGGTGGARADRAMLAWSQNARRWQDRLTRDEPLSLFQPSRLAQALTKSAPP